MNGRNETGEGTMRGASQPLGPTAGSRGLALSAFYAGLLAMIALGTNVVRTGSVFPALGPFVLLGLASAVVAIVLGVMGRHRSARGTAERRFATAGLVIGIGIVLAGISLMAFLLAFLGSVGCM